MQELSAHTRISQNKKIWLICEFRIGAQNQNYPKTENKCFRTCAPTAERSTRCHTATQVAKSRFVFFFECFARSPCFQVNNKIGVSKSIKSVQVLRRMRKKGENKQFIETYEIILELNINFSAVFDVACRFATIGGQQLKRYNFLQ